MNEDKIIEKIVDNTTRLDRIEEDVAQIKEKVKMLDSVVSSLDEIKGMFKKQDTEQTANVHAIRRHEKRIGRLEDVHDLSHSVA